MKKHIIDIILLLIMSLGTFIISIIIFNDPKPTYKDIVIISSLIYLVIIKD